MADLVEFLRARLNEDERLAQAGRVEGDLFIDFKPSNGDEKHPGEAALLAHIGNWDPARVLAEVETKRRIIDYCESAIEAGEVKPGSTWNDDAAGAEVGVAVLHLMASPYADHPDYDRAWAVAEVSG